MGLSDYSGSLRCTSLLLEEWIVDVTGAPQVVEQDGELAGHGYTGPMVSSRSTPRL